MKRSKTMTAIFIAAGVAVAAFAIALAMIVPKWPFTRAGSLERLQHLAGGTVEIKSFRPAYFPYAGYIAEGRYFPDRFTGSARATVCHHK